MGAVGSSFDRKFMPSRPTGALLAVLSNRVLANASFDI
jgi:hypothetical protein